MVKELWECETEDLFSMRQDGGKQGEMGVDTDRGNDFIFFTLTPEGSGGMRHSKVRAKRISHILLLFPHLMR